MRRITQSVKVGNVGIGSDYPISIQSMLKCKTTNIEECTKQIKELEKVHCDLLRVSVPDKESVEAFSKLLQISNIPLIADIHYSYDLATDVLNAGAKKIRMNPGNMSDFSKIDKLVSELKNHHACIRIGVNAGSTNKQYENLSKVDRIVQSTIDCVSVFENLSFHDIVLGLKSSDIDTMVESNIQIAQKYDYPMHIGVTESGPLTSGLIKSSIGISRLLEKGIGDTVRVSLSSCPIDEVIAAKMILKTLGLKKDVPEIISCPTCARTSINVFDLSQKVEKIVMGYNKDIKVAIMGCPLNGVEEGKNADLGIAGGEKESLLFIKGQVVKKISNDKLLDEFINLVNNYIGEMDND